MKRKGTLRVCTEQRGPHFYRRCGARSCIGEWIRYPDRHEVWSDCAADWRMRPHQRI